MRKCPISHIFIDFYWYYKDLGMKINTNKCLVFLAHNPKVIGSNPIPATNFYKGFKAILLWSPFLILTPCIGYVLVARLNTPEATLEKGYIFWSIHQRLCRLPYLLHHQESIFHSLCPSSRLHIVLPTFLCSWLGLFQGMNPIARFEKNTRR